MTGSKILQPSNFLIFANAILILLSLYLIDVSNIDLAIQNQLFNFENRSWRIDEKEPIQKFFFYNLPKILFALIFVICSFFTFKNKGSKRKKFILILLGLALIPAIAGNIKKFTNIYCPKQLEIYNGNEPYIKIFQNYPDNFIQKKSGKCFPAGHCIVGFAYFIFFFALEKRSHRFAAFFAAFFSGWITGFYQMAKGAHFFGDTLIAMLLSFFIAAIITKIYTSRLQKTHN